MEKIRIYIGHKLTNATPEFIELMNGIKLIIESAFGNQCEFLRFVGMKDGTRAGVYDQDIDTNIKTCDLFICIVDQESTGLGMEIGASLWKSGKPTLVLYHKNARVGRLTLGAVDRNPEQMLEHSFEHASEAVLFVQEAITLYRLDTDDPVRFRCLDDFHKEGSRKLAGNFPPGGHPRY